MVWGLSSQQSADELSSPEPPSFTLWHRAVFQGNAAVRFPPEGMGTHTSSWGQDRVWRHRAAPLLPQLPSQILSFQPRCGAAHPNAWQKNSLWGKGRWGDSHYRETEALSTHTLLFSPRHVCATIPTCSDPWGSGGRRRLQHAERVMKPSQTFCSAVTTTALCYLCCFQHKFKPCPHTCYQVEN